MSDSSPLEAQIKRSMRPPQFGEGKMRREHLVDRILLNLPRRLIVIAAPAGYGKTTLLADFIAHSEVPTCWVQLTDLDNDALRFAEVLMASLRLRFRRLNNVETLPEVWRLGPEEIAGFFSKFISDNIDTPFAIILDDVHLIDGGSETMTVIDELIANLPELVTVIASGREVPEVSLAKLMAEGNLVGFGPHDLALDLDELRTYLSDFAQIELPEIEINRLFEDTRGWITGVVLSSKLASNEFSGLLNRSRPMVYEYLASVVLNRLKDDLRRFLLDSSVLPSLSPRVIDQVLDRDDAAFMIEKVYKEGLFLEALGREGNAYEFHPQFREFLLENAEASDRDRVLYLRLRAAEYFISIGELEDAIEQLLVTEESSQAIELIESFAEKMHRRGRLGTLIRWRNELNLKSPELSPNLTRFIIAGLIDRGEFPAAREELSRLDPARLEMLEPAVQAAILNISAFLDLEDGLPDQASEKLIEAELLLRKSGSETETARNLRLQAMVILRTRSPELAKAEELTKQALSAFASLADEHSTADCYATLSTISTAQGRFIEAREASAKAVAILENIGSPLQLAISKNNLAVDMHLRGEFREALDLFNEALKNARFSGSRMRESLITFSQADLFCDLGLVAQAGGLYEFGLALATEIGSQYLLHYGCLRTSILHRRWGSGSLALDWLKRAISFEAETTSSPATQLQLAALEMSASVKNSVSRLVALENLDQRYMEAGELTLLKYLLGKAAILTKEPEQGREMMGEALRLANRSGTEQILAAELLADPGLLETLQSELETLPVFESVVTRINLMISVGRHYGVDKKAGQKPILLIRALGQTQVMHAGQPISELTPFARELLIYLIDRGGRVPRDHLLDQFWADYPPGRQVSNLHMAIYSLRRALPEHIIESDGTSYYLSEQIDISYDVADYERAHTISLRLPPGDPRRYFAMIEAINAYDGTFMPEYSSEWVLERRRILESTYLELLARNADEALVRNQPHDALKTIREALRIDPYRDDLNQRMLEALAQLGRRSEIVAHYRYYVQLLAGDLSLGPSDEISSLYSRLIK